MAQHQAHGPLLQFVTDATQSVLAAGNRTVDLVDGQIGIFSQYTNLSVDAAEAATLREFYLAVGKGGDFVKSMVFKQDYLTSYTYRCYTPAQSDVYEITDLDPTCETEYAIKLLLKSRESIANQSNRPVRKTYPVVTSCCEGCSCPGGDANDLAIRLARTLVNDTDMYLDVKLIPNEDKTAVEADGLPQNSPTLVVTEEIDPNDTAAVNAYLADTNNFDADGNPTDDRRLALRIYTREEECNAALSIFNSGINLYNGLPSGTLVVEIAGILGFDCMGNITKVRNPIMEQMSSNSATIQGYFQQGFDGSLSLGVHRQTRSGVLLDGSAICGNCSSKGYHVLNISQAVNNTAGWRDYTGHSNSVQILIPACAPNSTTGSTPATGFDFIPVLDAAVGRVLADDAAACPACDVTNTVGGAASQDVDGLTEKTD